MDRKIKFVFKLIPGTGFFEWRDPHYIVWEDFGLIFGEIMRYFDRNIYFYGRQFRNIGLEKNLFFLVKGVKRG